MLPCDTGCRTAVQEGRHQTEAAEQRSASPRLRQQEDMSRRFEEFFDEPSELRDNIVQHVNAEAGRRGGADFDLREVRFPIDFDALENTVRSVLQQQLDVLAEIIWRYRADVLLLSGRPSRLPI